MCVNLPVDLAKNSLAEVKILMKLSFLRALATDCCQKVVDLDLEMKI